MTTWSRGRRNFGTAVVGTAAGWVAISSLPMALLPLHSQAQAQAPGAELPQRHALLVGVSQYPSFPPGSTLHLQGPKNDVQLIRTLLQQRGFEPAQVTVLADEVPDAAMPTRAAILGALDILAAKAKAGDFIFLYFAGHGSQMPADPATPEGRLESDGLHEIFLPRDTGRWDGSAGTVQNAIPDFELNRRLDAMLAKDAFVWAIFDACHSATLMRSAADPEIRYRYMDPAHLGLTQDIMGRAEARAGVAAKVASRPGNPGASAEDWQRSLGRVTPLPTRGGAGDAGRGGFVAFYAAQTTQVTPEMRLPAGDPTRKPYGLFGYTIAEALSAVEGVTYRQLSQYILQRYSAQNLMTPTPLFTGTHLDAPVFGSLAAADGGSRQWPLAVDSQGMTVGAGLLSQLTVGTQLVVLPGPLAPSSQALGTARVDKATITSASLVWVADADKAAPDLGKLPAAAVARLAQAVVPPLRLRVLAPPPATGPDADAVGREVLTLQQAGPGGVNVEWVKPGEALDVRLVVSDGQVWLVPPSGQFYAKGPDKTHSINVQQPQFGQKLAHSLQLIGRVQNLLRIAAALQDSSGQRALQLAATLKPVNGAERPLNFDNTPQLSAGDRVTLQLKNSGRTAIDLTALYIDSSYGVDVIFPGNGESNRIEAGGAERIEIVVNDETTGLERMMLIAVEARSQQERSDFSFLRQARLERTRAYQSDTLQLFMEAGFGADPGVATRGGRPVPAADRTDMRVLSLRVK